MTDSSAVYTPALRVDLQHEPLPAEKIVCGNPSTAIHELEDLAGCGVGIWEMTPGTATDIETEEAFVVLSGKARILFLDHGSTLDIATGDVVRLREGQRTSWTVTKTLRKIYFAA